QRTILAITGALTELVSEAPSRVNEVTSQFWESRALAIAAERRIPDLLKDAGEEGIDVQEIANSTGIEGLKLCQHFDIYTSSDHLPNHLLGPKGHSYSVEETAWQEALGYPKARWDWLEEHVTLEETFNLGPGYPGIPGASEMFKESASSGVKGDKIPRPELAAFGLAMTAGGRIHGAPHPYDYPWAELGEATVVDVGGGVGGFAIQLSQLYPKLKFVIQDRGPAVEQGQKSIWPKEAPAALAEGRVEFMAHDFLATNPVRGAEVYWIRYCIHSLSDKGSIQILASIAQAMSANSRILICDQVMNSTCGCEELKPAPEPLPANYGYYARYSHQRDICMMSVQNGIERTPQQFKAIVEAAGLRLEKIWPCRSQVLIVEARLP
ncbi:MAG: hypothetical protein Q9214_007235, partial [Letrouitia sp. 1 TL-2023]